MNDTLSMCSVHIGMSGDQACIFTGSDCSTRSPGDMASESQLGRPCMVMQLRKENALHHVASLIESFTVELSLHNMLSEWIIYNNSSRFFIFVIHLPDLTQ